jgi:toxin ParE1/3/4
VLAIGITPSANTDLLEIWEFIAADNPDQADTFIGLIDATFQNLSRQADLGRMHDELAPGLDSFPIGRYPIVYLLDSGCLRIVRVLHGARDLDALFTEPEAQ